MSLSKLLWVCVIVMKREHSTFCMLILLMYFVREKLFANLILQTFPFADRQGDQHYVIVDLRMALTD